MPSGPEDSTAGRLASFKRPLLLGHLLPCPAPCCLACLESSLAVPGLGHKGRAHLQSVCTQAEAGATGKLRIYWINIGLRSPESPSPACKSGWATAVEVVGASQVPLLLPQSLCCLRKNLWQDATWPGPRVECCEHGSYQGPQEPRLQQEECHPPGEVIWEGLCLDHPHSTQVSLGANATMHPQGRDCPQQPPNLGQARRVAGLASTAGRFPGEKRSFPGKQ